MRASQSAEDSAEEVVSFRSATDLLSILFLLMCFTLIKSVILKKESNTGYVTKPKGKSRRNFWRGHFSKLLDLIILTQFQKHLTFYFTIFATFSTRILSSW